MASRFSSNQKNNTSPKHTTTEAAAIIPSTNHTNHDHESLRSSPTKKSKKSKSKKSKNKKKQNYVMINTSFEDGDYDIDEEDTPYTDDNPDNIYQNTNGTNSHTQIAEESHSQSSESSHSSLSQLEEVELCSPTNNENSPNNNNNHTSDINAGHKQSSNGKNNVKYGLSAYYGVRLNYSDKKWHDIGWAVVWLIHCIVLLIVLVIVWTSTHVHMPHAHNGIFILLFLLAFAVIFSFAWTALLKYCGGYVSWVLILGNLIFIAAFASFAFIVGDSFTSLGVLFTVLWLLFAVFAVLIRHKISYTIALLQLGSSILVTTPSALMVAFGVLICQIFWMFIWGSIVVAYTAKFYHTSETDFGGILFILILSFVWTHSVIKNIGHTTICAITAHWYFSPNAPYPTMQAMLRSCTTSLGSIVFGSLFVSILQGLRAYIRVIKDTLCDCYVLDCCLQGFDGLLEYFNTYAFVHVAVYNTAYMKSGKNTFDLLSMNSNIYALINSGFIEYALLCGSMCGGVLDAILASWCANLMKFETDWVVLFTCFGFMIGMALSASLLNAVSSCVVALFVCYAEEPNCLIEMHPEQHLRFDGAKKGIA